jgi:hypothetical protein
MMRFNRELAINELIDSDVNYINSTDDGALEYLRSILGNGFTGYYLWEDNDLIQECANRDIPSSRYFESDEE